MKQEIDIKHEISNFAPTIASKRAIWFLLLGVPVLCALVSFLNPIMLELNSKQLTWLQIHIAITMTFVVSIFLNFHFYKKSKALKLFVEKELHLLIKEEVEKHIKLNNKIL